MTERAYIAVGSNLGDRALNCRRAVELLAESGVVEVIRESRLFKTEPWGLKGQPEFINSAVEVSTGLPPEGLLKLLKSIEARMGRTETVRWGPRVIDLDIIFFGDKIIDTPGLRIPHPGAHERAFVLVPLNDIAPDIVHPVLKKTVSELFKAAGSKGVAPVSDSE